MIKKQSILLFVGLLSTGTWAGAATPDEEANLAGDEIVYSDDARFVIGAGLGIVRFDVNGKVTDKQTGGSWYIDLEGNLDLDKWSKVRNFYASYRFSEKHSLLFNYFDIDRRSTVLSIDENFEDLLLIDASIKVRDVSRFYNLAYGYNLFRDSHSHITLIAGLNVLDLDFKAEARGSITVAGNTRSSLEVIEGGAAAPLPLIGLNFNNRFTPEWSLSTKISFVRGSHEAVSAMVLQTEILSRYQFSRNVGLLLGLTYFTADVDNDEEDELSEIAYEYDGLFIGLHLGL